MHKLENSARYAASIISGLPHPAKTQYFQKTYILNKMVDNLKNNICGELLMILMQVITKLLEHFMMPKASAK